MRKLPAALTVMAMAALGTALPVSSAHAAATCSDNYSGRGLRLHVRLQLRLLRRIPRQGGGQRLQLG
ncbi:hypothetical protein LV779_29055 [Streptomyces thinghirensis]|nr:hypothetical protein [Streptomyces thinghirensis]